MPEIKAAQLERLERLARTCGLEYEDGYLSDVVRHIFARKASRINHGGPTEQLKFLLDEVGEEEAARIINGASDRIDG